MSFLDVNQRVLMMIIIDSYFGVCFLTVIVIRVTTLIFVKIKTKLIPSDKKIKTSDHLNPTRCSSKRFGAGAVRGLSAIDALRVVPLVLNINIWVNFV